ncbi:hypothetical protein Vretimale_14086 [Volvox reticuliferus]|nr:hypothetical protein Vretimale_14086 [Volvox reticuliferus]
MSIGRQVVQEGTYRCNCLRLKSRQVMRCPRNDVNVGSGANRSLQCNCPTPNSILVQDALVGPRYQQKTRPDADRIQNALHSRGNQRNSRARFMMPSYAKPGCEAESA